MNEEKNGRREDSDKSLGYAPRCVLPHNFYPDNNRIKINAIIIIRKRFGLKLQFRARVLRVWQFIKKWKRPIVTSLVVLPMIFIVWYYNLPSYVSTVAGGTVSAVLSFIKDYGLLGWGIYMFIEWLSGKKDAERQARLYAQAKQKLEDIAKRREELKGYLKKHYENDLLPVMRDWFKSSPKIDPFGPRPLSYFLLSGYVYYQPHGESVISRISEPMSFQKSVVDEVAEHLSTGCSDDWGKWISLKNSANSQLSSVKSAWKKIEKSIKIRTEELGLVEWDGRGAIPEFDYYHVRHLVEVIWSDPEYYQHQGKHLWDECTIQSEGKGYQLGGVWAYSQTYETLEKLEKCLSNESKEVSRIKRKLLKKKSLLEREGKDFESFLKRIEDDWVRRNVQIPSSCPTCKDWLDELAKLGA